MRLIFLFIAIALAAGAFVITMQFTKKDEDHPVVGQPQVVVKEAPTTNVYTAKQEIATGTIITPSMLDIQPWPSHLLLSDMVVAEPKQPSDLVKMVARTSFAKGEPLIRSKLANEKDPNFLAAALPKGKRAMTIAADMISGVAGFVFPGDDVDVLITHDVVTGTTETKSATGVTTSTKKVDPITEILLSDVRVLAVNQKSATHAGEPPINPVSISLEVSPSEAQKLRLAETGNGKLSVVLRSLKDKDNIELVRPTAVTDLSHATPPGFFPVLYDYTGQAIEIPGMPSPPPGVAVKEKAASSATGKTETANNTITVVKGVKAESVEVERP
jgi:pilus assembly protein CpaB